MTETIKTPDTVVARSLVTRSVIGGDDVTILVTGIDGDEVAQFGKGRELQDWLTREGYVYFTGSRGVWIKAPKVQTKEDAV